MNPEALMNALREYVEKVDERACLTWSRRQRWFRLILWLSNRVQGHRVGLVSRVRLLYTLGTRRW